MRVVIAGGGTGGHLFPGIALAEEFKARDEKTEVLFIGSKRGIEGKVVPKEGYPIKFLKTEGILGKSPLRKAVAAARLLKAVFDSRKILKAVSPDVVVGTGGYASAAPVASARMLSIPTLIMEQNLVPGLANRLLSRLADAVAVTYHESMPYFPKEKTYFTGNPVRRGILQGNRRSALGVFSLDAGRFTVFVSGGSSGARTINNAILNALSHLLDIKEEIQFLHQSGEKDYESVRKAYRQIGFKAMVAPFIFEMAEAYAAADMAITRAGATTIAELTALGVPAIIVPYPHAAGHQEFNAKKLDEAGAAIMVEDHALDGGLLAGYIKELYRDAAKRSEMRGRCMALGRPDAARRVADIAASLVKARA